MSNEFDFKSPRSPASPRKHRRSQKLRQGWPGTRRIRVAKTGVLSKSVGLLSSTAKVAGGFALKLVPGGGVLARLISPTGRLAIAVALAVGSFGCAYYEGDRAAHAYDAQQEAVLHAQIAEQQQAAAEKVASDDAANLTAIKTTNAALALKVKELSNAAHAIPHAGDSCLPADLSKRLRQFRSQ